eukprot:s4220_g4.t1
MSIVAMSRLLCLAIFATISEGTLLQVDGSGTTNPSKYFWKIMETMEARLLKDVRLTYRAVGSSNGQREFTQQTSGDFTTGLTDFAAGDIPMDPSRYSSLTTAGRSMVHVPFCLGAIGVFHSVPAGEVGDAKGLKLSPCVLAKIMKGEITTWDHDDIKAENPNLNVPAGTTIKVGHRTEGSSSTTGFTGSRFRWNGVLHCWYALCHWCDRVRGYLDAGHGHQQDFQEVNLKNEADTWLNSKDALMATDANGNNGVAAAGGASTVGLADCQVGGDHLDRAEVCDSTPSCGAPCCKALVQTLLMHPPRSLEGEVQDLREEVEDLRAEVRRLRRGLSELRALVVPSQGSGSSFESDSRESADPGRRAAAPHSTSGYPSTSPERAAGQSGQSVRAAVEQSAPAASTLTSAAPSSHTTLTWLQREEICDQIGRFLARSIAGGHRGSSGREKINLPSRLWVIVRDYAGQIYTPVKVVRTWTSCKVLCKPNNYECGDSVFVGLPSEREARRVVQAAQLEWPAVGGTVNSIYPVGQLPANLETFTPTLQIIQIGSFDGRLLVAVPAGVWHRSLSRRVLAAGSLVRATLVEVQAADPAHLAEPVEDLFLQVWIGFIRREMQQHIEVMEEFSVDFLFDPDNSCLPFAQALVDVANEHFAFFSADGDGNAELPADSIDGEEVEDVDAGLDGEPMTEHATRVDRLEAALLTLTAEVKKLAQEKAVPNGPAVQPRPAATLQRATKARAQPRAATSAAGTREDLTTLYPLLDPGVAAAALQAGIPHSNLEAMQGLLGQGGKIAKTKDMNPDVTPEQLSEEEMIAEQMNAPLAAGASGSAGSGSMAASLQKLTTIVELLTDEKKKRAAQSKLETALDGNASGSTDPLLQGTGKKAAAARRALRYAFEHQPLEIAELIEKHMCEDLNSMTLGPGMQPKGLNARAWVEYRSHITAHKTGAFAAWSTAGILDCLLNGQVQKARARCGILLMMLDQASIDRGSWSLAGELALEPPPPLQALGAHQPPAVHEGESPFSRLLDARWAELALNHLKEQEEYLSKRRNLSSYAKGSKDSNTEGGCELEPKRKARPKPRPKNQPAGPAQEG